MKKVLYIVALFVIICYGCRVLALETLPPEKIKIGMKGIAKTVVEGTRIDEFNVEVLGVLKHRGPSGDLILIKTSGPLIDKTGGIVEGMSGSPVYINGKLVGAVAYGWGFADHRIGMVTCIGDMLKILDLPQEPAITPPKQDDEQLTEQEYQKYLEELIEKAHKLLKAEDQNDAGITVSPKMRLYAGGFSGQALKNLQKRLEGFDIVDYAASDLPEGTVMGSLKAGGTVGVELARGDTTMGAIGTVTWAEGDKILAFGHPFLKKGAVNFVMTNGYIFQVVNSIDNGFKMGVPGEPVGCVFQDRGAGIAGTISRFPGVVPLKVTVKDKTTERERQYYAQTVIDESLTPELQSQSVVSFIDKTLDRTGQGTAKVDYEITARYMPGMEIKRSNMFYSDKNISDDCVGELREILAELTANRFNPIELLEVNVNVEVTDDKLLAAIIEAKPDKTKAAPGDKINVEVQIRPYRGDVIKKNIEYIVPENQKPGDMMLEVRGGSQQTLAEMINAQQQLANADLMQVLKLTRIQDTSFKEALKDMLDTDCNNDLVIEQLSFPPEMLQQKTASGSQHQTDQSQRSFNLDFPLNRQSSITKYAATEDVDENKPVANQKSKDSKQSDKKRIKTDYIIIGDTQIVVSVLPSNKQNQPR